MLFVMYHLYFPSNHIVSWLHIMNKHGTPYTFKNISPWVRPCLLTLSYAMEHWGLLGIAVNKNQNTFIGHSYNNYETTSMRNWEWLLSYQFKLKLTVALLNLCSFHQPLFLMQQGLRELQIKNLTNSTNIIYSKENQLLILHVQIVTAMVSYLDHFWHRQGFSFYRTACKHFPFQQTDVGDPSHKYRISLNHSHRTNNVLLQANFLLRKYSEIVFSQLKLWS